MTVQSLPYLTPPPPKGASGASARRLLATVADQLGLIVVIVLLVAFFGAMRPRFLNPANFLTIANQVPSTVVAAVGMTYVLILGGIDLSVGSVLGLCGAAIGVLMAEPEKGGAPLASLPVAVLAALGVGILCGAFNGLVSTLWAIPSFIVTLGMLEIARGTAHWLTESRTQYIGSAVAPIAAPHLGGLSLPFFLALGAVILGQVVLSRTVFGRYVVAIGTNEQVVRLSGIDPRPVKVSVFILAGLLAAVGAVLDTSKNESASPNARGGFELEVIAAVVVGGTSLMGGRGNVVSSFLGVVLIAILGAGLAALDFKDETKRLVTGAVIVLAALLDHYRRRFAERRT